MSKFPVVKLGNKFKPEARLVGLFVFFRLKNITVFPIVILMFRLLHIHYSQCSIFSYFFRSLNELDRIATESRNCCGPQNKTGHLTGLGPVGIYSSFGWLRLPPLSHLLMLRARAFFARSVFRVV